MAKVRILPDREYVREMLDYDPETGSFRWRVRPPEHFKSPQEWRRWNTRYANTAAGHEGPDGYLRIYIGHRGFLAHRLAWLLMHGEPVPTIVDHISGNTRNNQGRNLRAADYAGNIANARLHRDTTTGIKGVFRVRRNGKFMAHITRNRQRYHIGVYDTIEEAAEARREAAIRLHGEFARHT